ncbi:FmdE family protein [Pusillimonas sp. SM2304]|uniref:FmdE family protein n=1 Tax=Pusillimonas sp. SM2304 TaxID=3073241 RepID=UPI0028759EE6|nr:FmdE family protein [Pusillimonas sp. SM2304]MDS1139359.1 FmdE family protein [Pusillimonas sp. SM2304]
MTYPAFFDQAPKIVMQDPLSALLGAATNGIIEYAYGDIVKLAGHSCPTVAGAYLMTRNALKKLYGDALPQRGGIKVEFRDSALSGVTGVIANVVGFITGATADTGFKGLGGQYDRRNLMFFDAPIAGEIRFQRLDTAASVEVAFHANVVPAPATLMPALHNILSGQADQSQKDSFGQAWQERVRQILEQADHPGIVTYSS